MLKQSVSRIRKTLPILLAVLFVVSLTAVSASAHWYGPNWGRFGSGFSYPLGYYPLAPVGVAPVGVAAPVEIAGPAILPTAVPAATTAAPDVTTIPIAVASAPSILTAPLMPGLGTFGYPGFGFGPGFGFAPGWGFGGYGHGYHGGWHSHR